MDLVQSTFLRALGWSLIDSVWQVGILWVLYLAITGNGRRYSAGQRHSLALLSLVGGSAWFLFELIYNLFHPGSLAFSWARELALEQFSGLPSAIDPLLPFVSLVYLLVCIFLFLKLLRQYQSTKTLTARGLQKIEPSLRLFTETHSRQLGITRRIQIWLSANIDSPLTIGFWKPMILLPLSVASQLSIKQTEAVILHELNHIRRNDYVVNLAVAFSTVVLFFNPFARMLTTALRNEREHCCDDLVLQFQYEPLHYAEALLLLEKGRVFRNAVQLKATGTDRPHLFDRVKRILTGEPATNPVSHRMLVLFLGFLIIGFCGWYRPSQQLNEALLPSLADGFVRMEMTGISVPTASKPAIESNSTQRFLAAITPLAFKKSVETASGRILDDARTPVEETIEISADNDDIDRSTSYVTDKATQDFTIYEAPMEGVPAMDPNGMHPYIPASTLDYTLIDDTTVPKPVIPTAPELEAREAMDKAMLALDEIDWLKLEKELKANGSKTDILKLQKELRKAVSELNWRKLSAQMQDTQGLIQETDSKLNQQLQRYRQEQALKQQKWTAAREQALLDRLDNNQSRIQKNRKIVSL